MAKEHTRYQQKIIRNYYQNQDAILLQRLQELVTNLYLAEGAARKKHWKTAATAMEKIGVSPQRVAHLLEKDDPALLAKLVEELMAKK